MLANIVVPIVIVGFRNSDDVVKCLAALDRQRNAPQFGVFICENGGTGAFDAVLAALTEPGGPCAGPPGAIPLAGPQFVRNVRLALADSKAPVIVAEAESNLGFAGGINAWVRLFLAERGWSGVWILNPDTWPEPDALAELADFAAKHRKGMVTSRIMIPGRDDIASSRGLKWSKWAARTTGVDIFAPVDPAPDPDDVERRMDSPTGVSFYVTRECIDKIGLMEEGYFLYYEEFDWGILAKAACGIGYAHKSVVPHISGSSTGAVRDRARRSQLSVYLQNRNKLHFVRRRFPGWYPWTVLISFARTGEYLIYRAPANFVAAWKGLFAGLRGEWGRPDHLSPPPATLAAASPGIAAGGSAADRAEAR
jgi:N-acetylglucosaminyl-diphospho-decaprenol L-rhamnosyltransferase